MSRLEIQTVLVPHYRPYLHRDLKDYLCDLD